MPAITSIGTATPQFKRSQLEAAELISDALNLKPHEKRLLRSIYKSTGIESRYSVLGDYCKKIGEFEFFPNDPAKSFPSTAERMKIYKNNALGLALSAVNNCLFNLNTFNKIEITHLITVSCTGMYAPGVDIEIVQALQLNPTTKRTTINFMGCYGAFNGLKLAESICKAEPNANVLVVCIEICTIHFQKNTNMDNIISNAIFADGAAAALIQNSTPQHRKCLKLANFYCALLPQSNKEMAWCIGDNGFDIVLSSYLPEIVQSNISEFIQMLLIQNKIALSEIDFFAIHPGGNKILQACEKALGIKKEDNRYAYKILKNYGNMSSATILFVLNEIFCEVLQNDHNKSLLSCAFGPGLTFESMLLQIHSI